MKASKRPTNLLLVTFLIPSAVLLGVLVLGEQLEWNEFAGGTDICGLITIDGRNWWRGSSADRVRFGIMRINSLPPPPSPESGAAAFINYRRNCEAIPAIIYYLNILAAISISAGQKTNRHLASGEDTEP